MGRKPNLHGELLTAKEPETRWHGGRKHQWDRLKDLPAKDWALPNLVVPQLDNDLTQQYWWCKYSAQAQEHLFKECLEYKAQQQVL